jgi:hypothetical protein
MQVWQILNLKFGEKLKVNIWKIKYFIKIDMNYKINHNNEPEKSKWNAKREDDNQ